ncbi:MAG: DUF3417 domain-containing protein, partial [Thermodesulfobacteriota bacterium]|nr:DUF3417 domain-containing protein [Thermodesulfobacteriota bacterium]
MKNKEKFFPNLPNPLKGLGEIANNLWWSWHPGARMLFKRLDRKAWKESGHNPVKMLRELPEKILETALNDHEYLRHYNIVLTRFKNYKEEKFCWFLKKVTDLNNFSIAYFSSEYGLHHSLPFYAGGLGFLAGDFLKECSDLGVPLVA